MRYGSRRWGRGAWCSRSVEAPPRLRGAAALVVAPPTDRRRLRRSVAAVSVVVVVAMAVGVGLSFALREESRGAVLVGPVL